MRFTRLRDARRSENQVTRFASDSLIFFRPARCSVGSSPEAEGMNVEGVRPFPQRFALSPFEGGGWGDVPLRSDTVYPA
ncbi:hypothetical protein [Tannerella sp.]|uniref:hypothetical protein n=1 Tax=Tannerella sp. TaxID=2382127 RepID=UPI003FA28073